HAIRSETTAGRTVLTHTAPQAAIVIAHDDPVPRAAGGHALVDDAEPEAPPRRRLPIVKSPVAPPLILIIGAGYAGWRYTQTQYYVGENAGHVAIFRGINQTLAGLKLSSIYRRTEIPLAGGQVTQQEAVRSTISATSLDGAQRSVERLRSGYQTCVTANSNLSDWEAKQREYIKLLDAYKKKHQTTGPVRNKAGKITAIPPPKPGAKPTIPADCPPPSAAAGTGTAP